MVVPVNDRDGEEASKDTSKLSESGHKNGTSSGHVNAGYEEDDRPAMNDRPQNETKSGQMELMTMNTGKTNGSDTTFTHYYLPVNTHKKLLRGEKLYVTRDQRSRGVSRRKVLICAVVWFIIGVAIVLAALAATGIIFNSSEESDTQSSTSLQYITLATDIPNAVITISPKESTPAQSMELKFTITNVLFDSRLLDKSSPHFLNLQRRIENELYREFLPLDVWRLMVDRFSEGSVVVYSTLQWSFDKSTRVTSEQVYAHFLDVIQRRDGFLGVYAVMPKSVSVMDVSEESHDAVTQAVRPSDFGRGIGGDWSTSTVGSTTDLWSILAGWTTGRVHDDKEEEKSTLPTLHLHEFETTTESSSTLEQEKITTETITEIISTTEFENKIDAETTETTVEETDFLFHVKSETTSTESTSDSVILPEVSIENATEMVNFTSEESFKTTTESTIHSTQWFYFGSSQPSNETTVDVLNVNFTLPHFTNSEDNETISSAEDSSNFTQTTVYDYLFTNRSTEETAVQNLSTDTNVTNEDLTEVGRTTLASMPVGNETEFFSDENFNTTTLSISTEAETTTSAEAENTTSVEGETASTDTETTTPTDTETTTPTETETATSTEAETARTTGLNDSSITQDDVTTSTSIFLFFNTEESNATNATESESTAVFEASTSTGTIPEVVETTPTVDSSTNLILTGGNVSSAEGRSLITFDEVNETTTAINNMTHIEQITFTEETSIRNSEDTPQIEQATFFEEFLTSSSTVSQPGDATKLITEVTSTTIVPTSNSTDTKFTDLTTKGVAETSTAGLMNITETNINTSISTTEEVKPASGEVDYANKVWGEEEIVKSTESPTILLQEASSSDTEGTEMLSSSTQFFTEDTTVTAEISFADKSTGKELVSSHNDHKEEIFANEATHHHSEQTETTAGEAVHTADVREDLSTENIDSKSTTVKDIIEITSELTTTGQEMRDKITTNVGSTEKLTTRAFEVEEAGAEEVTYSTNFELRKRRRRWSIQR